jgi:hypothetical protein
VFSQGGQARDYGVDIDRAMGIIPRMWGEGWVTGGIMSDTSDISSQFGVVVVGKNWEDVFGSVPTARSFLFQ